MTTREIWKHTLYLRNGGLLTLEPSPERMAGYAAVTLALSAAEDGEVVVVAHLRQQEMLTLLKVLAEHL